MLESCNVSATMPCPANAASPCSSRPITARRACSTGRTLIKEIVVQLYERFTPASGKFCMKKALLWVRRRVL